jgi:uncharacterized repeat protein (TIGR01451 family)
MMTFYSLVRPYRVLTLITLACGLMPTPVLAQISCPTLMPRSMPLSICSQADSLSFVYTNNNQNQRISSAKATIDLPYGTKIRYRTGSVKGTSTAGLVTENNVADVNKPIFTIPIPNYLESMTITFAVDVSCEALDLAKAALPKMKITLDYTGSFSPVASPLTDVSDSEPFNIQSAILAITPDMNARSLTKDSPFNRCFSIQNTGFGSVDKIYLYDTTAVGANFVSATAGGAAATVVSNTNITWNGVPATVTKFVISGTALGSDGILTPNETVNFCESMILQACGSFKTSFRVEYKCTENGAPCSVATGNTTIDTDPGTPIVKGRILAYEKPNGCPSRHVRMSFRNDGVSAGANTAQAIDIELLMGFEKDSSVVFATDIPLQNFTLNGRTVTATNSYGKYILDLSQFATDPDGAGGLADLDGDGEFDDLALGDSLIIELDYKPLYFTVCNDGFRSRQFLGNASHNNKCLNREYAYNDRFFMFRNILLNPATQDNPEPIFNSYPVSGYFYYRYKRDIQGYDLTGATGVFKISLSTNVFTYNTTVYWNGVPLTGTIVGDTMTVTVSNAADYLDGWLGVLATNFCPTLTDRGKPFVVNFEITYGGCGGVTKEKPHCPRPLAYSGVWGCGAFCYIYDPNYASFTRYTAGFADGTETTSKLNDLTRLMPGDIIESKGHIYTDIPAYDWNTSNARPWFGYNMYAFSPGGNGSGSYPTLQEVIDHGDIFHFYNAGITYINRGSGAVYSCSVTAANNDGNAARAITTVYNDVIMPGWKALYPHYITENRRDTVMNNINYSLFETSGETFVYRATQLIGPYASCGWSGIDWRDPFDLYMSAYFGLNPYFKNKYGKILYKNPHDNYADYTASSTDMQIYGYILDPNNPVQQYRNLYPSGGGSFGICGWKFPVFSIVNPEPHLDKPKKSYSTQCTTVIEHEAGYDALAGDMFAAEHRAPWRVDTLTVQIPAGYRVKAGTAQLFYEQNGVGTYMSIANPASVTGTAHFINNGTWKWTDDASGFRTGYKIRYEIEQIAGATGVVNQMPYVFAMTSHNPATPNYRFRLLDTFTVSDKIPVFSTSTYDVTVDNKHCTPNRTIDFKFVNGGDAPMLNSYIAFEGNAGVTIDSIVNITIGSPLISNDLKAQPVVSQVAYNTTSRFAKIGTLVGDQIAVYRVYYKSSTCGKDSIKGYLDWGCSYPVNNQPNLASTTIKTATARISLSQPGLQAALIYNNTEITLCDDVTYEFEFKNTQLSDAYNVNLKAMLPAGMRYMANSAKFKLPAGAGTYANFSAGNITVVNAGTSDSLVLKLGQFDSPTNVCGLKTAADTANSKIRVQFKANYTTCPPPMASRTAKFYTSATNFCKDTTLQYNIVSKPIHFTDEDPTVRNTLACTVVTMPTINGSSASAQQLTCTFKVKNEGSGGTTIGKDSIQINLPKGLTYSSTANVSGLAIPTSPRIVNGTDGQTLMYLLPAGMTVGGETQFNLVVTTDPSQLSGHCNQNVPIAMRTLSYKSPICAAKNLTCDGANQGCEIQGSAFNDANIFCCPVICLPVVARRN